MTTFESLSPYQQATALREARIWLGGPAVWLDTETTLDMLNERYRGGQEAFLTALRHLLDTVEEMMRTEHQNPPVGAIAYNGYWHEEYEVLTHHDHGCVTVRWASGRQTTHRTPFNPYRDRILQLPRYRVHLAHIRANMPLADAKALDALVGEALDAALITWVVDNMSPCDNVSTAHGLTEQEAEELLDGRFCGLAGSTDDPTEFFERFLAHTKLLDFWRDGEN